MKLLITLILIFCFHFGNSQTFLSDDKRDTVVMGFKLKYEIVPVVILVCDTAENGIFRSNTYGDSGSFVDGTTMWLKGFQIKYWKVYNDWFSDQFNPSLKNTCLDKNKKPLSESLVVWMTKEIIKSQ